MPAPVAGFTIPGIMPCFQSSALPACLHESGAVSSAAIVTAAIRILAFIANP